MENYPLDPKYSDDFADDKEKTVHRRQKLLYLIKMLFEETDADHGLSQPEIKARLEAKGISVDRKAMYYDIEAINTFFADNDINFEIQVGQGRSADYRVIARPFEAGELKLLCDAVSSAKFISERTVNELIAKLGSLSPNIDGAVRKRNNVLVTSRKCISAKEGNVILYNVEQINRALEDKKKISFCYFQYDTRGHKVQRKGVRVASPYNLVWKEEQYYLICNIGDGEIRTFRVDRMDKVEVLSEKAEPRPADYNVNDRVNQAFSMFSTEAEEVKLRFSGGAKWMNTVIDRFGTGVRIVESTDDGFTIRAAVQPSDPFYGWLFEFGDEVEILSPEDVRTAYSEKVKKLCRFLSDK